MLNISKILKDIPKGLRTELIKSYNEIAKNYAEQRWEPAELNGGKFCEVVYTIIKGHLDLSHATRACKPRNMLIACQELERTPADKSRSGDRSLRILIPRMLTSLYEIRNNRGVGHVGGDVDPNLLDATAVYSMASWVLAELIRIFHGVPTHDAQEIVNALCERKHPIIWSVMDKKRVLSAKMKKSDQVLLLLYSQILKSSAQELCEWVEYANSSNFKKRILQPLHTNRFIEFDVTSGSVHLSPSGAKYVEENILHQL